MREFHEAGEECTMGLAERREFTALGSTSATMGSARQWGFPMCVLFRFADALGDINVKSVALGSTKTKVMWPTAPRDLLPFGEDETVRALLHWHRVLVYDTVVFYVCGAFLRICRFLFLPSMVARSLCKYFVAGRALVDMTLRNLSSPDYSKNRIQIRDTFSLQARCIDAFLEILGMQEQLHFVYFVRGYETKLVQVCSLLLHVRDDPRIHRRNDLDWRAVLPNACMLGQKIYRLFHMHMYPRPAIPVHPDIYRWDTIVFPPPASVRNPKETVISYIQQARGATGCSTAGCESSLQTVGRNLRRCAKCNIVSYCGRECQARAWREEKYPHKRICPMLQGLVVKAGGVSTFESNLLLNQWKQENVQDEDVEYVVEWILELSNYGIQMPDGTEWTPGFEDYDEVVMRFGADGGGPKPAFMNRLARWPSEVAKEKALLEVQPFRENGVDC